MEQYVLDNITKLLSVLRECNTTIRWLMLHRVARSKKIREQVLAASDAEEVRVWDFYQGQQCVVYVRCFCCLCVVYVRCFCYF